METQLENKDEPYNVWFSEPLLCNDDGYSIVKLKRSVYLHDDGSGTCTEEYVCIDSNPDDTTVAMMRLEGSIIERTNRKITHELV
jgi:hypothetical protein